MYGPNVGSTAVPGDGFGESLQKEFCDALHGQWCTICCISAISMVMCSRHLWKIAGVVCQVVGL